MGKETFSEKNDDEHKPDMSIISDGIIIDNQKISVKTRKNSQSTVAWTPLKKKNHCKTEDFFPQ